jgi:hypothetical protein
VPPDLAEVVALWGRLPGAVRAGIVAMVRAAATSSPDDERSRIDG